VLVAVSAAEMRGAVAIAGEAVVPVATVFIAQTSLSGRSCSP
jgi:hypothetical protein